MISVPRSSRQRAVFMDTSALFAFVDATDQWHDRAREAFAALVTETRPLLTSNLVFAETHALVMRRLGVAAAWEWLRDFDFYLEFESLADHEQAMDMLARYRDRGFSYADVVSFAIMEREGVATALAFDNHFRQYGWTLFEPSGG